VPWRADESGCADSIRRAAQTATPEKAAQAAASANHAKR